MWIGEFAATQPTVMLFQPENELAMIEFRHGSDIGAVLGECFGFEFYLTSHTLDYFLVFNHHDCVVAAGSARDWLASRASVER